MIRVNVPGIPWNSFDLNKTDCLSSHGAMENKIMNLLRRMIYISVITLINYNCFGIDIPARSLVVKNKTEGIHIRVNYKDVYPIEEANYPVRLNIHKNDIVGLQLYDSKYDDGYKFDPTLLEEICKQDKHMLQSVIFSECEDVKRLNRAIDILSNQSALQNVSLFRCEYNKDTLKSISNNKSNRGLTFNRCEQIDLCSLSDYFQDSNLYYLELEKTDANGLLENISKLKSLRVIILKGIWLKCDDLRNIDGSCLGELTLDNVRCEGESEFDIDKLQYIAKLQNLTELTLIDFYPANYNFLSSLKKLKVVRLNTISFSGADLKILGLMNELEEVDISNTDLSGADFNNLKDNVKLKLIKLHDVKLSLSSSSSIEQLEKNKDGKLKCVID